MDYQNNNDQSFENQVPSNYQDGPRGDKAFTIASFVLGVTSIATYGNITSLILGIIGVILSIKAKNMGNTTGMRKAGFILSIIGVALWLISIIAAAVCATMIYSTANNIFNTITGGF